MVAAAAAARRARRAGSHAEAALFRELEQAERSFSAGSDGAQRPEAASGGGCKSHVRMSMSLQAAHVCGGLEVLLDVHRWIGQLPEPMTAMLHSGDFDLAVCHC